MEDRIANSFTRLTQSKPDTCNENLQTIEQPETGNWKLGTTDTKKRSSPPLDAPPLPSSSDRARFVWRRRHRLLTVPSRGGRVRVRAGRRSRHCRSRWRVAAGADQFGGAEAGKAEVGRAGKAMPGVAVHLRAATCDQFLFQTRSQERDALIVIPQFPYDQLRRGTQSHDSGTFSVPLRNPCSCPPPSSCGTRVTRGFFFGQTTPRRLSVRSTYALIRYTGQCRVRSPLPEVCQWPVWYHRRRARRVRG